VVVFVARYRVAGVVVRGEFAVDSGVVGDCAAERAREDGGSGWMVAVDCVLGDFKFCRDDFRTVHTAVHRNGGTRASIERHHRESRVDILLARFNSAPRLASRTPFSGRGRPMPDQSPHAVNILIVCSVDGPGKWRLWDCYVDWIYPGINYFGDMVAGGRQLDYRVVVESAV